MAAGQEQLSQEEQDARAMAEMFPEDAPSESDVYRADQLLVSATGSLKPVYLAPSVATVITAVQIEKMGATTLDEILETVPGLHVAPSGLNILSSIWSVRGIRTSINPQVLLLLNGVGINSASDGGRVHRYNMPVSMISRVEVIRGPGSAIYGADAFAGTINVITKDGHEVNATLRRKNIAKYWDVAMSVRNLFDEDAQEPSPYDPAAPLGAQIPDDYPMEERAFWAELRFHF